MVELYTMIKKERLPITTMEFRRKFSARKILLWLQKHGEIALYQGNDVICEVHPAGTGERLETLNTITACKPRTKFQLMDDGSIQQWPGGYHDVEEFYRDDDATS